MPMWEGNRDEILYSIPSEMTPHQSYEGTINCGLSILFINTIVFIKISSIYKKKNCKNGCK